MRANTRRRLGAARGAMHFVATHPDPNPSANSVGVKLTELVNTADGLMATQREANVNAASAVNRKAQLREDIGINVIILARTAKMALPENPNLTVHLRLPKGRASEPAFLSVAQVALKEAIANKELFLKYGMPSDLLDIMTAQVAEFEAAIARQKNANATQAGANAELEAVTADIMGVLNHLDAINRLRFKHDAELRAAWKTARNVPWVSPEPVPPPVTPAPVTPPAEGTSAA